MPSALARRGRAVGLVPILLIAICAVVAVQIANFGDTAGDRSHPPAADAAAFHRHSSPSDASSTTTTTATTTATTTTTAAPTTTTTSTTVPPPPPPPVPAAPAAATTPPPAPAPPSPLPDAVPPRGEATAWGCAAALAYLAAYADPGFSVECPGNALGHEAMSCLNEPGVCPNGAIIAIADPCPAAYMNEASNSWVLEGQSSAPLDPYGEC